MGARLRFWWKSGTASWIRTAAPWSLSEKVPITTPLTALWGYLQQWRTILAYALAEMEKLGISPHVLCAAEVQGFRTSDFAHAHKAISWDRSIHNYNSLLCARRREWRRRLQATAWDTARGLVGKLKSSRFPQNRGTAAMSQPWTIPTTKVVEGGPTDRKSAQTFVRRPGTNLAGMLRLIISICVAITLSGTCKKDLYKHTYM